MRFLTKTREREKEPSLSLLLQQQLSLYLISLWMVWRLRNLLYFLISRRSGVFLRFCFLVVVVGGLRRKREREKKEVSVFFVFVVVSAAGRRFFLFFVVGGSICETSHSPYDSTALHALSTRNDRCSRDIVSDIRNSYRKTRRQAQRKAEILRALFSFSRGRRRRRSFSSFVILIYLLRGVPRRRASLCPRLSALERDDAADA